MIFQARHKGSRMKIIKARSLEEAQETLRAFDERTLSLLFYRWLVRLWVLGANFTVGLIRRSLFHNWDPGKHSPKSIAVYTHGIVGDNVVMLPVLAALKERFPEARLTLIGDFSSSPEAPSHLFKTTSFIDRLIVLDRHPVLRSGHRMVLDARIDGAECDLFVNLAPYGNRGWLGAVLRELIFAKRIGARFAVGFRVATKRPKKRRTALNSLQHHFVRNEPCRGEAILKELGLPLVQGKDLLPRSEAAKASLFLKMGQRLNRGRPFVVMTPGGNLAVQRWPLENFRHVAEWMSGRYGVQVVITGRKDEVEIGEGIAGNPNGHLVNLVGKTDLQELIELLRAATFCITNDTGTMHLAAMIGLPTVALFGTRIPPTWWFPKGHQVRALFCLLECSYCYNDFCEEVHCLNRIGIEDVIGAVQEIYPEVSDSRRFQNPTKERLIRSFSWTDRSPQSIPLSK